MSAVIKEKTLVKLDIGCGPKPKEGFTGIDASDFGNKDIIKHDLRITPWPFENSSVSQVHCSHFLEHLTNFGDKWERVRFFNELWRVMIPGTKNSAGAMETGIVQIIIPHWASHRYYGDPTHKEPFAEMAICYLDPVWRENNAPHTDIKHNPNGYDCHFECIYNYNFHPEMVGRSDDYVRMAVTFWKEAVQDISFSMIAIKK